MSKGNLLIYLFAGVAIGSLLSYTYRQWPEEVEELPIPPGHVMYVPKMGKRMGICTQGDPYGLSVWYLIGAKPDTENEKP